VHEYREAEQPAESAAASGPDAGKRVIADLVNALQPLDRAKTELLYAASHQLRTPLTCIVGFIELLVDGAGGPITAEQERILRTIARNTSRLAALIDALEPEEPSDERASCSAADRPWS